MAEQIFTTVKSSSVEGRLENVQQRKKCPQKIHKAVKQSTSALAEALQEDGRTETDALLEIHALLHKLRQIFDHLDFQESLSAERILAKGGDYLNRDRPLGVVLVLGGNTLPLAQSIVQLAFAIAAGNTVVLLLSPEFQASSVEVQKLLELSGLDKEAVQVVLPSSCSERQPVLADLAVQPFDGIVIQNQADADLVTGGKCMQVHLAMRLIIQISTTWPTIVSRHADLKQAAMEIARAKFLILSGASPAAPSVVFVDEYVLEKFCSCVEAAAREFFPSGQRKDIRQSTEKKKVRMNARAAFEDAGCRTIKINGGEMLVGLADWRLGWFKASPRQSHPTDSPSYQPGSRHEPDSTVPPQLRSLGPMHLQQSIRSALFILLSTTRHHIREPHPAAEPVPATTLPASPANPKSVLTAISCVQRTPGCISAAEYLETTT
ncbi:hypothetical protein G7Y89_g11609 [Cudoniella acicularis]|uniref:Aldehyde dehydrogenase domain-containing protein n=1 Tax=Cudoniella acicularis TaxID=354080 RepID=A0A8H4RD56_9HELO|nr:hypothetical protein G7Y89_g11609 [Cudoniella acicularis]